MMHESIELMFIALAVSFLRLVITFFVTFCLCMDHVFLRSGCQMDECRPVRGADRLQIFDSRCMADSPCEDSSGPSC